MKILKCIYWSMLLLMSTSASGQHFNFSQYNETPLLVNPANVVASDYEQANLIYRNQNTAADFDINSGSISYQTPFRFNKNQRHFLGIGFSAMDDRTGGIALLEKQHIGISAGINVALDESQTLNIGFSTLVKRLNFSLDGLETGFQYENSNGANLGTFLGENFANQSKTTLGLNAGVLWEKKDEDNNQLVHFGWALYDINQPAEFLKGREEHNLPISNIFQVGFRAFKNEKITAYPQVLALLSGSVLNVNTGIKWEYTVPNGKKISLLTNYIIGSYGSIGFQLAGEKFSAGLSYDLGFASTQVANTGAVEISFAYRKLVREKRKPIEIVAEEEEKKLEGEIEEIVESIEEKLVDKVDAIKEVKEINDTIVDVVEEIKPEIIDKVEEELAPEDPNVTILSEYSPGTSVGELIYSNVRMEKVNIVCEFDFNQSILKQEVRTFLDDLSEELNDLDIIAVEIIGHTDAVGKADYNMQLSTRRAHAIASFLAEQGIPWGKMSVTGKGESQPLPGEANDKENRRVEVLIFSQNKE